MSKYTDAKKASNKKWDANNLDRISYTVPKGKKTLIEAHAKSKGKSINGLINSLLLDDMGLSEWPEKRDEE